MNQYKKNYNKKYYLQNKDMYYNNLKKWRLKNKEKIKINNKIMYMKEKKDLLDQFEKDIKQFCNKTSV